ncbi:hypothetical protein [Friedmanniella luteola]|uniref:hypothetical protein n=1 Tax=Friedmanniella luteola TaxID=546871 RepID=UPI0018D3FB4F|nr:hypothetical protein [Friedmanniella luteola]
MNDNHEIKVSISIPQDSDGFIRRECPHCMQQFKWHDGPANEEAEHQTSPVAYSCPLCGQPAALDSWHTTQQVKLIQQIAMPQAMAVIQDDLEAMFRGVKGMTYKRSTGETFEAPVPLTEPDDMVIVASPCHGYEPVKVPEEHTGPLFCLVCGSAFAV